jgi:tRNA(fMet)-specific endonuclease VapC
MPYRYMLDTNTVSHLLKGDPSVVERLKVTSPSEICISVVTKGELLFGLAKRPDAKRLRQSVLEFLKVVDALPIDDAVIAHYGPMRADLERQGKILGPLDMLIAAHAGTLGIVLVTSDKAFSHVEGLALENWAR